MAYHKKFRVVNSHTNEEYDSFDSIEKAEQLMIILQGRGEQATVKTDDEDIDEAPSTYDIEGLELEEPGVDFGSELDDEFSDPGFFDEDSNEEISFD